MCRNIGRIGRAGWFAAMAMTAGLLALPQAAQAAHRCCTPCGPIRHVDPAAFQFGFKQQRFLASRSTNFLATRSTNVLADKDPRFLATRSTRVLAAPHHIAPDDRSVSVQRGIDDHASRRVPSAMVRGDSSGYAANRAPVCKVIKTGQKSHN